MRGFAEFALPDMIVREDEMSVMLPALAMQVGQLNAPEPDAARADHPFALEDVYDAELEKWVQDVYQRDYMTFGFGSWR